MSRIYHRFGAWFNLDNDHVLDGVDHPPDTLIIRFFNHLANFSEAECLSCSAVYGRFALGFFHELDKEGRHGSNLGH